MRYLEYKETLQRGSVGFPFAYYHITPSHPRYTMPPHWHDECELIRIQEGTFTLMVNREIFSLHAGDTAFINSGFLHSGIPEDCRYECIVFDLDYYLKNHQYAPENLSTLLSQQKLIRTFFPASMTEFQEIFRTMVHALSRHQTGYTLMTEGALYHFLGLLLRRDYLVENPGRAATHSKKFRECKTILNYIALHYTEPITLKEMAECVHMNPNYFCRFFREMTHQSPIAYLNYYRIECACEKLCMSNARVLDIALDCGFSDVNYFIKVFKKYKNMTPLQYLKQHA